MAGPLVAPSSALIERHSLDRIELFVLFGEFDAFTSPRLEEHLIAAVEAGRYEIVLDMTAVTFVDISTLSAIQRVIKSLYRHNGHLVLATIQHAVLRAIDIGGFRHAIRVFPTVHEAVEAPASERKPR